MLKASATDGGNNVGNLLAYNNYWQSIWSPNGGKNDPKIDPVYGVYLDIDFSNKPLSQAFSFNYLPRNWYLMLFLMKLLFMLEQVMMI